MIGHTGFITLEAMRRLRDVGAAFMQIDSDSNVVAMSARDPKLHLRDRTDRGDDRGSADGV